MNIIIYEDNNTDYLKPFSINHASFEMQCGVMTNLERIEIQYKNYEGHNEVNFILLVRSEIEDIIRSRYPHYEVNPSNIPEGKYLNGSNVHMGQVDLDIFPNMPTDDNVDHEYLYPIENIWDCIFMFKDINNV